MIASAPTEVHAQKIKRLQSRLKVPNPVRPEQLQCTLLQSREPKLSALELNALQHKYICTNSVGLDIWDNNLVLILNSEELSKLSSIFHEKYQVEVEKPFIPHITLSYEANDFDIQDVDVGDIIFDCITTKPI